MKSLILYFFFLHEIFKSELSRSMNCVCVVRCLVIARETAVCVLSLFLSVFKFIDSAC